MIMKFLQRQFSMVQWRFTRNEVYKQIPTIKIIKRKKNTDKRLRKN